MHRCFLIPELREHILHSLTRGGEDIDGSSLLRVAQTCSVLNETAIDIMWKHQCGLANLMMCLPSKSWAIVKSDEGDIETNGGYELSIIRPLVPEDWARVQVYSHRIKHLVLRTPGKYDQRVRALPSAIDQFSRYRISAFLLPSLCSLDAEERYVCILNNFLCYGLRALHISSSSTTLLSNMISFLLSDVARMSPHLTSLTLNLVQDGEWPLTLPYLLGRVRDLQNVFIQLPGELSSARALVGWLTLLPNLTALSLHNVTLPAPQLSEMFGVAGRFEQLRKTTIEAKSLPRIIAILNELKPSCVDSLSVVVDSEGEFATTDDIQAYIKAILYACSPSMRLLESLILPEDFVLHFPPQAPPSFDDIKPLLSFRHLESLCLWFNPPLMIKDEELEELAKAWPHLRTLDFGISSSFEGLPPTLTINCLASLCRHCGNLEDLHIYVDARAVTEIPSERSDTGLCCKTLRKIDVGLSPISAPGVIATFLSDIFPKLEGVEVEEKLEYTEEWEEVSRLLKGVGSVRVQEQRQLPN